MTSTAALILGFVGVVGYHGIETSKRLDREYNISSRVDSFVKDTDGFTCDVKLPQPSKNDIGDIDCSWTKAKEPDRQHG